MKRIVIAVWLGLAAFILLPGTAQADQGNWSITRYEVEATAARNGVITVRLDFDFDFADQPGHGPYVTLPLRQEIAGDPDHYRSFGITDISADSPSGAPDAVATETKNGALAIKIGDENTEVTGIQNYQLSYRISGVVNPKVGARGQDEIFWNIIGQQWEIPLHNISVNLTGPAEVADATCFVGEPGSSRECDKHQVTADGVTYSQQVVEPGSALTLVAGWPGGTFVGAEPKLVKRYNLQNTFGLTPLTGGLAALLALVGSVAVVRRSQRKGRDEAYLGLTPGLTPRTEQAAAVGRRGSHTPVAVQFRPPEGVGPGEMGTLTDEVADPRDVTATIVDLAVRGHLRIEEVGSEPGSRRKGKPDWRLVRLSGGAGDLRAYERTILDGLFSAHDETLLSDLGKSFVGTLGKTQRWLYQEVTSRGWFRANPFNVRASWYGIGAGIVVLGALLAVLLALTVGWGLVGVGVALVGVVTLIVAHRMPARTAEGTAVLAQSLGFKLYLETAEADQIRFEEGEDIFSRYLPFAIAFDVAERWAKVFADLAAQGRQVPEPGWYVGTQAGFFTAAVGGSFADSLNAFSETATAAMVSATVASGGGSGFSGGAGAGGGVGGGGGGGW